MRNNFQYEQPRLTSKTGDTRLTDQPPTYSDTEQPLERIPATDDEIFQDVPTDELIANFQKLRCKETETQNTSIALNGKTLAITSTAVASAPLYPSDRLKEMTDCREVSVATEAIKSDVTASKSTEKPQNADQLGYPFYRHGLGQHAFGNDVNTVHVADSVLAPKPFSGLSTEDPEAWLEYFERYARYRDMTEPEKARLFPMFLRDGASDWVSTLPERITESYYYLRGAFVDNFFQIAGTPVENSRRFVQSNAET